MVERARDRAAMGFGALASDKGAIYEGVAYCVIAHFNIRNQGQYTEILTFVIRI